MANDSSLSSASNSFDFETQSGVMHLLASVRASDVSPNQKNELRDLIFLYSNGGHDHSVRNNLEQKLTQFSVAALPNPKSHSHTKAHSFGTSRPSPAFKAAPVQVIEEPVNNAPVPPTSTPQPAAVVQPVVKSTSVDTPNTPVQAEPTAKNEEIEQPPEPQNTTTLSPENSLQRVKEIKALVNEKVGNPVNLVNINNEVGREYMGALLDAMKKVNSGSSAASAMQRLETAYTNVEAALKNQPQSSQETKPVVENNAAPAPAPAPAPTPTPAPAPAPTGLHAAAHRPTPNRVHL
jgi:hypothetical protein